MLIVENTIEISDWIKKKSWDLPFNDLDGFFASKGLTGSSRGAQIKALQKLMA